MVFKPRRLPEGKRVFTVSRHRQKNILLTGRPGCGKSTIIEKVVSELDRPCTGFFSREIRREGRRVGFSIATLDGKRGRLAHTDIQGGNRVGKYGVDIKDIEEIAVTSMMPKDETVLVVIDEIGKMECLSDLFKRTLLKVLDSGNPVLGSVALRGDRFIEAVRKRPDVRLIMVSEDNRDFLAERIRRALNCRGHADFQSERG